MDSSEATLTATEYEALEAFRKIASLEPGEWIADYRLAERSGRGGRLSQTLRRLAKKGVIRQHPESGSYYRLLETEENERRATDDLATF